MKVQRLGKAYLIQYNRENVMFVLEKFMIGPGTMKLFSLEEENLWRYIFRCIFHFLSVL